MVRSWTWYTTRFVARLAFLAGTVAVVYGAIGFVSEVAA